MHVYNIHAHLVCRMKFLKNVYDMKYVRSTVVQIKNLILLRSESDDGFLVKFPTFLILKKKFQSNYFELLG